MRMRLFFVYIILLVNPFVLMTHQHPHTSNETDQQALIGFMSAITTQSLPATWNPNVSVCRWPGITCSVHRQRVVSLDVPSMELEDLQCKALIFPLMENGSLEKWLYPSGDGEQENGGLSLIQRLNIAIDVAHGMAYLHHHCFVQVIHCDLKPSNVLLGDDMTAYLIDFGIATICFASSNISAFTSTHAVKGSVGYIPPEYGLGGLVTVKGDVYSYGIVLLEMLTGKKPTHNMFVEGMNLQNWVSSNFPHQIGEVVDKNLLKRTNINNYEEDKELNCISQLISVGLLCTRESPSERPNMTDIVNTLQNTRNTFLGTDEDPKFQTDIWTLVANKSTTSNNASDSSLTF